MGGRYLPFHAWMNFISACQHMLNIQADHPEIWQHFLQQALEHIQSTADFSDAGPRFPLNQAIATFCDNFVSDTTCTFNYPFSIGHSEILFQLHPNKDFDVDLARHRAYLCNLFRYFRNAVMTDRSILHRLEKSCYDFHLDLIPILNSGHITDYFPSDFPSPPATFTPEMLTLFYTKFFLDDNWRTISNQTSSEGLRFVVLSRPSLWNPHEWSCDVVNLLNYRFSGVFYQRHNMGHVGFVTTYGPTSLACTGCGLSFVPEWLNLQTASIHELEIIRKNRDAHFKQIYEDNQGRQANAPYHRVIRSVLRTDYPGITEFSHEMLRDCVIQMKKEWGNFYVPELLERLTFQIESYLALRRRGAAEDNDFRFMRKLLAEIGRD